MGYHNPSAIPTSVVGYCHLEEESLLASIGVSSSSDIYFVNLGAWIFLITNGIFHAHFISLEIEEAEKFRKEKAHCFLYICHQHLD